MTKDDAKMFPIIASCSLLGLYIAFKYFNEKMVKELIFIYLLIASAVALASLLNMKFENFYSKELFSFSLTKRMILHLIILFHIISLLSKS